MGIIGQLHLISLSLGPAPSTGVAGSAGPTAVGAGPALDLLPLLVWLDLLSLLVWLDLLPLLVWLDLLARLPSELAHDDAGEVCVIDLRFVVSGDQSTMAVSSSPPPCSLLITSAWLGVNQRLSTSYSPILLPSPLFVTDNECLAGGEQLCQVLAAHFLCGSDEVGPPLPASLPVTHTSCAGGVETDTCIYHIGL